VRTRSERVPWLTLATVALVAGTGFAGGGYFPSSWGWPLLAAGWAAALAALGAERGLGSIGAAASLLLVALSLWTALSAIWSLDVTQSLLEAQRTSVYAAAVLAALLWARERPARLLTGVWAAAALLCLWALITRLVPDRFGVVDTISGYRLSEPIGYWNSLGLLAAIGALLGLGLAARGPSLFGRVAGAASAPVFVTTLYFTFSRGAWLALLAGAIVALAVDRRRVQLLATVLALAPGAALVVWRGSVSSALTTWGSALPTMSHQGHELALVLADGCIAAVLAVLVLATLEPRVHLGSRGSRVAWGALAAAVVLGLSAVVVHYGSPVTLAQRAWHGFSGSAATTGPNLNGRLFHLSGNGRTQQWHVAWGDTRAHPLLGSGAGTFEEVWSQGRPVGLKVRDAHNLYLETLAELGPLGLLLLVGALALPLVGVSRRRELFAGAGAYSAFLLHAAVDWDWEIPAVTLAAVLCGAALLAAPGARMRPLMRRVAFGVAVVLGAFGIYTVAAQLPLTHLRHATARGDWPAAERDARRAAAIAPWSSEPWFALGESELDAGRLAQARGALRKATAKSPHDWVAWFDLARASTGVEAEDALARAVALNPLSPEIALVKGTER
jgi:hypothetical protein